LANGFYTSNSIPSAGDEKQKRDFRFENFSPMGREGFQEYLEVIPEVEDTTAGVQDAAGWRTLSSKYQ
jgi:hypothetical protein